MNDPSSLHSRETAWARAFRAKLDQGASERVDRGRADLGRAPSRLWLMDADELERLPIHDFIAAFAAPPGAPSYRRVVQPSPHGSGDVDRGFADSGGPPSSHSIVRHEASWPGRFTATERYGPAWDTWWRLPVGACAAVAAMLAFLIG